MVWNNPNELFGQSNKSPELAAGLDFSFHDSFFFLSLSPSGYVYESKQLYSAVDTSPV